MKVLFILFLCCISAFASAQDINLVNLSKDILYKVKTEQSIDSELLILKNSSLKDVQEQLNSDEKKKTFYINMYNAIVQYELKRNPKLFENRKELFKNKSFQLATSKLSLDDIEHGLLRKSQIKWGLGYIKKWFPGKFEKSLRVNKLDYRIHFALNCGANGCPAIAFYEEELIEVDLKDAEYNFVNTHCKYNQEANTVSVSMIFKWFKGDFGGKKGIYNMLQNQKIIPVGSKPKIIYTPYNWDLLLEQYRY